MNKKRKVMEIIQRNISFLLLFLSPFIILRGNFFLCVAEKDNNPALKEIFVFLAK